MQYDDPFLRNKPFINPTKYNINYNARNYNIDQNSNILKPKQSPILDQKLDIYNTQMTNQALLITTNKPVQLIGFNQNSKIISYSDITTRKNQNFSQPPKQFQQQQQNQYTKSIINNFEQKNSLLQAGRALIGFNQNIFKNDSNNNPMSQEYQYKNNIKEQTKLNLINDWDLQNDQSQQQQKKRFDDQNYSYERMLPDDILQ